VPGRVWYEGQTSDRRWPEDSRPSVRDAFEAERTSLLALPGREFALGERAAVQVGKTPYVRFNLDGCPVPLTQARLRRENSRFGRSPLQRRVPFVNAGFVAIWLQDGNAAAARSASRSRSRSETSAGG
jgi:hypothetical protein